MCQFHNEILQPSVMFSKGKTAFTTMTHCCKSVIIDQIRSLFKSRINQWTWQKKDQFNVSFFKVDFPDSKIVSRVPLKSFVFGSCIFFIMKQGKYTPYDVLTVMYSVHFTQYNVQSKITHYNVHSITCMLKCVMYSIHSTMYTVKCAQYNLHSNVYIIQCSSYTIHTRL